VALSVNSSSATATYSWDLGAAGLHNTNEVEAIWETTGNYPIYVTVSDNGCTQVLSDSISVSALQLTAISNDTTIVLGETLSLHATANSTLGTPLIMWEGMAENPFMVQPTTTTNYTLSISDEWGCILSEQVTVNVLPIAKQAIFPTAFSPNNDGTNDVFRVLGTDISTVDLQIYNRWGNQVFNISSSPNMAYWDGNVNGEPAMLGVYAYQALITYTDSSTVLLKGNTSLIR
jgi:gliding motility-associated-like protein